MMIAVEEPEVARALRPGGVGTIFVVRWCAIRRRWRSWRRRSLPSGTLGPCLPPAVGQRSIVPRRVRLWMAGFYTGRGAPRRFLMTTEHRLSPPWDRMTRCTNLTIRKSGDVRRADGRVVFAVVTRVEPTWCIVVFECLGTPMCAPFR